ncbi:adenosine kinase [Roseivirga pacifica]|uniref:adenosine kinase n=1 Tax=Roseivirga pacifica TaxID=1267423 RepID=UPI0020957D5D|nr:adenosine kinase [Roseivirga pacifica]MCO6358377.1 adenosine kinase [Roseivirga pacifica]MCO6366159.1 adenosine kinase [Roseivirga pacifica]MCO6369290.1 adenosine kinase [Roseivirga pacifica]MCO6374108.1 adenosine kinase [Roseivirga pacifica]MCO6378484.1 adenosine kinase [Roseivirga pacifica]
MKKYDVYGIGNALVDLELKVNDQFLYDHKVQKGLMTLVDEDTQFRLIGAINEQETERKSGGSAANTVIAVSQFGGNSFYSCKVANDEFGDFYLKDMNDAGVKTNLDNAEREAGVTGKCLVMITPDADRTMNTFLGATTNLSTSEVDENAIKDAKFVYLEGYLTASPTGLEAMKLAKKIAEENGVKTSITLSDPSIVQAFREKFVEVIGASVDLLFCNEEEAMAFTETTDVLAAREALKKEAKQFVITQGENGAIIFDGDTFIDIEPYNTKAIDTNGAGDMFAGAFLYGITNGMPMAAAGKLASMAASKVVSQFGPRLPWHDAQQVLKSLK